ncbi:MAG TPA: hypothetical protein IAB57_00930 [Candidatus Fimivivens faecavium]|nr:hypothetical protein [Candidatus Fimivivens faecavium]
MKKEEDVFAELLARGAATEEEREKTLSLIREAKQRIYSYCGIPAAASAPDAIFYPWVAMTESRLGSNAQIASVTEGDVSIVYRDGSKAGANAFAEKSLRQLRRFS